MASKNIKNGTWKSLEYTLDKVRKVMKRHNLDSLPSQGKFSELGYSSIAMAISKYHGGFRAFREMLGEEVKNWKDINYVVEQAREVIEEHGLDSLPNMTKLRELGYVGLSGAIHRYHGGFHSFREKLGESAKKVRDGKWLNLAYALEQAREVMEKHDLDVLPSGHELRKIRHCSLADAISTHHGGFHSFRKKLGEDSQRVKHGRWQDLNYVVEQAREVMEKHDLDVLPSKGKLREWGYSSLGFAIYKYHGGFPAFRKRLGEEVKRVEDGTWKDLGYVLEQAREVMEKHELDSLPSGGKLKELGYSSLGMAISKYYGGFPAFRAILEGRSRTPSRREQLEELLGEYLGDDAA